MHRSRFRSSMPTCSAGTIWLTVISGVYHNIPASERAGCAILAGNYGEAGAIDYYGPKLGLPKAISGHNSYFDWGPRRSPAIA